MAAVVSAPYNPANKAIPELVLMEINFLAYFWWSWLELVLTSLLTLPYLDFSSLLVTGENTSFWLFWPCAKLENNVK